MALVRKRGKSYGDEAADIEVEIRRYSELAGDPTTLYRSAACGCGNRSFRLLVDEAEGAAVRVCSRCESQHPMGDSADYLAEATLEECECPCGNSALEIVVGVALYQDSEDIHWLYFGCRCPRCRLVAVYADWKNEYLGAEGYLSRV